MIDVKIIKKAKSAVTGNAGGGYGGASGGVSVPGLSSSVATLTNIIESMQNVLIPVDVNGARVDWSSPYLFAVKSVKGFYSDEFLSAHGHNPDGGGSGGAAYDRLDAWADYSTDREGWVLSALLGHDLHTRLEAIEGDYVKLSELPSLTGYATEQWVLSKRYITQDALTPYLTKTDADGKFVTALGVSGKFLTWTRNGVTNNLAVPFATDADTVDGKHADNFVDRLTFAGSNNLEILKENYTAIANSQVRSIRLSHGSISMAFGYLLNRPITDAYGGWFIADYNTPRWIGVAGGGWIERTFAFTTDIDSAAATASAALASHTSNTTVHISATERALWNKAASDLSTILGSDSDTVINKWEEVVAFLDTYTEADTLAGLLGNKVDKVAGYGLSKNDFNDTLLAKLNGIEAGANRYVLPTASVTVKGGAMIGSGLMMASEVLSVNLNASHIPALDWSKITTGKPTTLAGYGITDAYTRAESNGLFAPAVAYNYSNGCLVRLTTLEHRSTFLTILIEGNTYYGEKPVKSIIQFYNYDSPTAPIIGAGATHYGRDFGNINAFNYDGHVYVWFKQIDSITTFFITAYESSGEQRIGNIVDTITNAPMPTEGVTRLVTIYPTKGLRTDNYASLLDSRYQQSANIHALTLAAGAFSAKTYDPKSGALTVNIPTTTDHIAEGGNLYFTNARAVSALSSTTNALQAAINTKLSEATFNAFKTAFDSMLELVNIGTDAAPRYAIHAKYGLYSDSFLSAHGLNDAGGNGGSSYSRLDAWNAYDSSKEGYVLSAKLGYDLYKNKADSAALSALASRVGTLEGKNYLDALTLNQNGSGNAVTSVALSADKRTLTVTKGATFLTEHQSLANYYTKPEIDNKYQLKGDYFRQGMGSLTTEAAFDIRSCQTNDIYRYNPYNFDEPYGTIVTFNDGHYGFGGQFYLPRLASSHISYRGRNDNTPNWSAWHKLAFISDIPSLAGYATESWVLGKNYLTAITKAMVENVLTGNITSHTHSQYITQHQSLAGYVTIDTEQTIRGKKSFCGGMSITGITPNRAMPFFLGIDAFADGGDAHFIESQYVANAIGVYTKTEADNKFALASSLSNYLPLSGGSMLNTSLVANLNADLLDGVHKDAFNGAARYGTTELHTSGYYKVKIKANTQWMLAFKILVYQSYALHEINIAGYNYSTSHWYNPSASLVDSGLANLKVTFGYDSDFYLWVAIPAAHYAGITVTDVVNGFWQVPNVHDLFEIVYEETLTGTVQTEITASRHATIADNVASATKLADNTSYTAWGRPFFADGKPQNVSGNLTGSNFMLNDNGANPYLQLYHDSLSWYVQAWNGKMFVGAGASKSIQIDRNGNLGIGLASSVAPAYKLDVSGAVRISEGLLIGGLLSANGGISTNAITATEIHLGPITLKYEATNKGLQVIGGGLYTDSYLSAHGPSPTTVDYEARIATLENKIAQLESRLNA